ncbi:acyltransferase family protein [Glutamicibacter ardleyensis]|uniref:acyltransferase family protein n=1 Tax=Glutamicibacter ardleyensis TaxID=225894 RepID=UPI003FD135B4
MKPLSAYDDFRDNRHFIALDGFRALSVVAVVWHHVSGLSHIPALSHGFRGVDLFFGISGFLITTLLLRERERNGRISLKNFYIRRSLRIFPLYYAVLELYCILVATTLAGTAKGQAFWENLPAFLTYTSNWFVELGKGAEGVTFYFAWSLATEEQFYLLWPPLIVLLLALFKRTWVIVCASLALIGLHLAGVAAEGQNFLVTILESLSPAIMLGATFAILVDRRRTFEIIFRLIGWKWAAPVLAVALLIVILVGAPTILIHLTIALLVVASCIREDTFLHRILSLRPLVFIGTISYGMYLMHMLAANVVRRIFGEDFGIDIFIATTLAVIFVAYLSFRFFESPLLKIAHRFSSTGPQKSLQKEGLAEN